MIRSLSIPSQYLPQGEGTSNRGGGGFSRLRSQRRDNATGRQKACPIAVNGSFSRAPSGAVFVRSSFRSLFLLYNDELTACTWALNSAVECHLHTVEVIGSNPIAPTILFEAVFSAAYDCQGCSL